MSRADLSAGFIAAQAQVFTAPGLLIEIDFSTILRLCNRQTVTWNGFTWTIADIDLVNLAYDAQGEATAQLILGNADYAFSPTLFAEGIANKKIKVWQFYGDLSPATADVAVVFDGYGDEPVIDEAQIRIGLTSKAADQEYYPFEFLSPATGFNWLPQDGEVVQWDGDNYTMRR